MNISRGEKRLVEGGNAIKLAETFLHGFFFRAACLRSCARTTCTHHVKRRPSPPPPPQFSGWTDCELVLDHRTVRLMAAAFLPQFGCFARSQINALDRHGRSCWRSASRVLPFTGSSILPFDFENWENTVSYTMEQGWSIEWTRWRGREKKKKKDSRVVRDGITR